MLKATSIFPDAENSSSKAESSKPFSEKIYTTEIVGKRILKKYRDRTVVLLDQEDSELFDRIQNFQQQATDSNLFNTALLKFGHEKKGDGIVKLVLEAPFYDFILEYRKDESSEIHNQRIEFENMILERGLLLEYDDSNHSNEVFIKIVAPFQILCKEAQLMKISFRLNQTDPSEAAKYKKISSNSSALWNPPRAVFRIEKLTAFERGDYVKLGWDSVYLLFFSSAKRILLTDHILNSIRVGASNKTFNVSIRHLVHHKVFTEYYPLHDGTSNPDPINTNVRARLRRQWVNYSIFSQPLDEIRNYFGEKIAFYFAWVGVYTYWLIPAAVLGAITFLYGLAKSSSVKNDTGDNSDTRVESSKETALFDHELTLAYTIIMTVWTTLFLEFWKRNRFSLSHRWGTLDFDEEERPRAEWKPTSARISPITGKYEKYVPTNEITRKKFISGCVALVSIVIVLVCVSLIIIFKAVAKNIFPESPEGASIFASILSLVTVQVLGYSYRNVALKLTKFENHRTESQFEESFVAKRFLFDFVNSYSTLFYAGIIKRYAGQGLVGHSDWNDQCSNNNTSCLFDLFNSLIFIFVGGQIINLVIETLIPASSRKAALIAAKKEWETEISRRIKDGEIDPNRRLSFDDDNEYFPQWEKDECLTKYAGLTTEYSGMVLQFGFVTMFVSAFPLGALCALINNVIELKLGSYAFVMEFKRPVPLMDDGIGLWENILTYISYFSVISNAVLIAFSSDWFYRRYLIGQSASQQLVIQLVFIMLYEHLNFGLKLLISYLIPDIPERVKFSMEKERYLSRIVVDGALEEEDDPEAVQLIKRLHSEDPM